MSKLELKKIFLYFDHELNQISQNTDIAYRSALKNDAQQVILLNKDEIDNWVIQLKERKISCYELEKFLESKRELISLPQLESIGMNIDEIDQLKGDILRLIAKSILNTFLDSLFKKPSITRILETKSQNWF
ncbi:MAG: hypothetical protein PHS59_04890 [Paludibacter sp.]|nr:hypothetical protein [Paludibacter sp.]